MTSLLASGLVGWDPLRDKAYQQTRLGPSVAAFLAWCDAGDKAPATIDRYERCLSRACLMFPSKGLGDFSDDDMLQVARTFPSKSRATRVAAFRSFFKWALRSRQIRMNPCDALPDMKPQPKRVYDLFTDPEITILCGLPIRDGALFQLMFDSGPRKGDCRRFRLRDYLPDATEEAPYGMLVFREGKGGKDRQVPATEGVARKVSELALFEGLGPNDHLWYMRPGGGRRVSRGTVIGDSAFHDWWVRGLAAAEVRYRKPHMTRHTYATRYLRRGGRLETLKLTLGHESIQTTSDEYAHLDMRDVARDMGLIGNVRE